MPKGNRVLLIIIFVLIVAAIAFVFFRKNSSQYNFYYSQEPAYTVAPGNTNSDLQQDLNTVDTSIKTDNDSQTNINQDAQVSQPNY